MTILARSRARLRWPTGSALGAADTVTIAAAADPAEPDFSSPLPAWPLPAWGPDLSHGRIGWGLSPVGLGWGLGAWGIGSGGFGWGRGGWGLGEWGYGGAWREWTTPDLVDGLWHFAIAAIDAAGNVDTDAATAATLQTAGVPRPAAALAAADDAETVELTWTKSPDDA